jgi:hypothetical protein
MLLGKRMQLKIQRSQRMAGLTGGTALFCLDVRADYSAEENDNIRKYKLGRETIYNSKTAQRHADRALDHLDRTQSGTVGNRAAGLASGLLSVALAKLSLHITIESLRRGHHIECKDLAELLEAEDTVRNACKGVTRFLDAAATFDGSEVVVEYDKGEEVVHITAHAPPLLEYHAEKAGDVPYTPPEPSVAPSDLDGVQEFPFVVWLREAFAEPGWTLHHRKVKVLIAGAIILFLLYEIF